MNKEYPQPSTDNIQEEAPCFRKFWSKSRDPEEPHRWGECMEDWHNYEWKKEQAIDCKRKEKEWEIWIGVLEEKLLRDVVL